MLYLFSVDDSIRIGCINPDAPDTDWAEVLAESIVVDVDHSERLPLETKIGIIRNVLSNGEAPVLIL